MKFFFIPGRIQALSSVEISRLLASSGVSFVELSQGNNLLLFDIHANEGDCIKLFEKLGGAVKVGLLVDDPYDYVEKAFREKKETKLPFAISDYAQKGVNFRKKQKTILGMKFKDWLKDLGMRPRFVNNPRELVVSSVLLTKNAVLKDGFELNLLEHPKTQKQLWGITLGVQDFEGFSRRDYDRPVANKLKGMLPPKLARMMVNLASTASPATIWDPFCGSGTVLAEALTLGYKVVGSDIDPVSIKETERNLNWICETYMISHRNYTTFQHDIKDGIPSGLDFDAVVTEPYLGPVFKSALSVNQFQKVISEIEPVYEALARVMSSAKKPAVVVVPGFKTGNGWFDLEFPQVPGSIDITQKLSKQGLQWSRPNSIIRRNLKIFEF